MSHVGGGSACAVRRCCVHYSIVPCTAPLKRIHISDRCREAGGARIGGSTRPLPKQEACDLPSPRCVRGHARRPVGAEAATAAARFNPGPVATGRTNPNWGAGRRPFSFWNEEDPNPPR